MRFGVHLGNYGTSRSGPSMVDLAVTAEQLGFASVWVSDHVVAPASILTDVPGGARDRTFTSDSAEVCFEAVVLLSIIAASTTRVRLGTSVLVPAQRNPLVTAKQLSTLDALSGGRVDVGVGAGWLAEEYAALGYAFEDRWQRLEDDLTIFRLVWTEREAAFKGATYEFAPLRMAPKPVSAGGPRITVGGRSTRALKVAARFGSGLNAARLTPGEVRTALRRVREFGQALDRDPSEFTVLLRSDLPGAATPADDEKPWVLGGPAPKLRQTIADYAESGVSELIVSVPTDDQREQRDALAALAEVAGLSATT